MWWLRFKQNKQVIILNKRLGTTCPVNGDYVLGYQTRAAAVCALRQFGPVLRGELDPADLEMVNCFGQTMDELSHVPVEEGRYALRHREGWYVMNPFTRRIWYANPGRCEAAWTTIEKDSAVREGRKERPLTSRLGFRMVRGQADGQVEVMDMWIL